MCQLKSIQRSMLWSFYLVMRLQCPIFILFFSLSHFTILIYLDIRIQCTIITSNWNIINNQFIWHSPCECRLHFASENVCHTVDRKIYLRGPLTFLVLPKVTISYYRIFSCAKSYYRNFFVQKLLYFFWSKCSQIVFFEVILVKNFFKFLKVTIEKLLWFSCADFENSRAHHFGTPTS